MQDFITYFLSHLPTPDEWVAYLLVNLVAYVAARNSVLRRERKAYAERAGYGNRTGAGRIKVHKGSHDRQKSIFAAGLQHRVAHKEFLRTLKKLTKIEAHASPDTHAAKNID